MRTELSPTGTILIVLSDGKIIELNSPELARKLAKNLLILADQAEEAKKKG